MYHDEEEMVPPDGEMLYEVGMFPDGNMRAVIVPANYWNKRHRCWDGNYSPAMYNTLRKIGLSQDGESLFALTDSRYRSRQELRAALSSLPMFRREPRLI